MFPNFSSSLPTEVHSLRKLSQSINIDNQLDWGHHIKDLKTSMAKKVKQLQRFKSLPSPILESIYYKGILPSVTYSISVWGNCSVAKLPHLEKINLSAAKLTFKLPEIPDSLTGLPFSWKPISYLYKLKILCLTHKIFYGVCPEKISSIITKSPIFRNMRDNLKLTMESPNTNIGRQSFRQRPSIVWNNIPQWVNNIEHYHKFKCKLSSRSVAVGNISFNDSAFCF